MTTTETGFVLSDSSIEALRKVKSKILKSPSKIFMDKWRLGRRDCSSSRVDGYVSVYVSYLGDDRNIKLPECGTVGCIAGWLADKDTPVLDIEYDAVNKLGLVDNQEIANTLLFVEEWPAEFRERLYESRLQTREYARVVADRIDAFIEQYSKPVE